MSESKGKRFLQKTAAKLVLENMANGNPLTKEEILLKAGYSPSSARVPKTAFESEAFKTAIKELTAELNIDKDSRLIRLAQFFWTSKNAKDVVTLSGEIAKMQGDYAPQQKEIRDLRGDRDKLTIIKPE